MLYKIESSFVVLLFVVIALGMIGCGGEEEQPTAEELTTEAWGRYETEKYDDSVNKFEEATTNYPEHADAYVGLGWTYGKMLDINKSISNFSVALSIEPLNPDALAGIAFAFLANDQYDNAIDNANKALGISPNYTFEHGNETSRDLHIVLAESYYYMGDFENAKAQVDILDPENELDLKSENYPSELLKFLETI